MAVDDQSEICFSITPPITQRTLPWQPIFAGFIHRTDGVAGPGPDLGGGANWAIAQGSPQLRGLHKNSKKIIT